jgi:putative spermidine/putrescine transport system permease protein
VGLAFLVTITCAAIGFPVAYYMARIASPRVRGLLVVTILLPLWASYLVKVFAWRAILQEQGVLNWLLRPLGLEGPGYGDVAVWLVFTYLWLPYMILPIQAGLERIPSSLLEASADLGGRTGMTFRRVILPLAFPAVVAGSIFTFSLTLGDYITPTLVSSTQFLGNVVQREVGVSGNLPLAAAVATIPIIVMLLYLFVARRLGAFEAL